MSSVKELLDNIKETRSLASDKALADILKASPQALSNWKHGTRLPDPVACARIAEAAGVPLARVLGIVGEARAISREEKAVWRRLAAAAAVVLMAGAGGAAVMSNGQTQAIDILGFNFTSLYIMRTLAAGVAVMATGIGLLRLRARHGRGVMFDFVDLKGA